MLSVCTLHMVCLHFQSTVPLTADFGVRGVRMGKMASVTRFSLPNLCKPWPSLPWPTSFSSAVFQSGSPLLQEAAQGPTRKDDSLTQYPFLSSLWNLGD